MKHRCYATGCNRLVDPAMLFCRQHWFQVPKAIRERVWATYQPGQAPTREYWAAVRAARDAVAARQKGEQSGGLFDE